MGGPVEFIGKSKQAEIKEGLIGAILLRRLLHLEFRLQGEFSPYVAEQRKKNVDGESAFVREGAST